MERTMPRSSLTLLLATVAPSLGAFGLRTPPPAPGCANPRPGWIWCDDFEQDRTASYFQYDRRNGSFTRQAGAGRNGSTAMRARWRRGQDSAGLLAVAFGRTPSPRMTPIDSGVGRYRDIYWRIYVRSQPGWKQSGQDRFAQMSVIAGKKGAPAAVGYVWSGVQASRKDYYVLDPTSGTIGKGELATQGQNPDEHTHWLGWAVGLTPILGSGVGQWYCVETHMRLNDPERSNGVFELWIDGNLDAQRTGLDWVGAFGGYGINTILLENLIRGGAAESQVRDYDDLVVSTRRIGCSA
jgi:hypothetical protein